MSHGFLAVPSIRLCEKTCCGASVRCEFVVPPHAVHREIMDIFAVAGIGGPTVTLSRRRSTHIVSESGKARRSDCRFSVRCRRVFGA